MKKNNLLLLLLFLISLAIYSCTDTQDEGLEERNMPELEILDFYPSDIPYQELEVAERFNHDIEAALGRILFYDTRLSYNNAISCGSCHKQNKGFSDDKQFSEGLYNSLTTRNSMALVNVGYHNGTFWNGMSGSLSQHVLQPVSNHIEMGMRSSEDLVERLNEIEDYQTLFQTVYNGAPTVNNVSTSLTSFISSLISYDSKYDQGKEVDFVNFDLAEKNGRQLFFGKAKCGECHRDGHFTAQWRRSTNIGLDLEYADQGAGEGRFKVPSLRNIELTAPYMHDGRFNTLEEVVEHYVSGIQDHPELDWTLRFGSINLDAEEKEDLVAFLKTLTDHSMINDPKFSNPF